MIPIYLFLILSFFYLLVLNLKGESPAKRGAKRKPTELAKTVSELIKLFFYTCSSLARREGGSVRRSILEQAAVSSGRMEADEQLVMSFSVLRVMHTTYYIDWREVVCL